MKRCVLFLSFAISAVHGVCSNGYEDIGNGNCYKTFTSRSFQREAEQFCEQQGGGLVQPQNAFVNAQIQMEAQNKNTHVWLGLTCSGTTKLSCTYSDGNQVSTSSYTNFAPGHPDPSFGRCVYLSKSGSVSGKWISGNCEEEVLGFGCQITSEAPTCGSSYSEYNNFCYKVIPFMSKTDAESACEVECAYLTSIHSAGENDFVRNISSQHWATFYSRIGLEWESNQYKWLDGTVSPQSDYYNFGHSELALGNCVGMALTDDTVSKGKWINTQCAANIISVCKRAKTTPCISFSVRPTRVPSTSSPVGISTLAPPTCSSTYFLQGSGNIYSPGYPNDYTSGEHCEYVIAAPAACLVTFSLMNRFADYSASPIKLYDSITGTVPFLSEVRYEMYEQNTYYASTGPNMKITFDSGSSSEFRWSGNYSAIDGRPSGCNAGVLADSGTITSINYPNPYPSSYKCQYLLEAASEKRINLQFKFIHVEVGSDNIKVYDGPNSNSTLFATYDGNFGNLTTDSHTSTTNQMFVTFTTDLSNAFEGFTADFSSV